MCCKTSVQPFDAALASAVLTVGQFHPAGFQPEDESGVRMWRREVAEENAAVTVTLVNGVFEITISPAISCHEHHFGKRITAGIYFEIAARYAEKVGGEIVQRATVEGCRTSNTGTGLLVARYPGLPMTYDRVCAGFQAAFLEDLGLQQRTA